MKKQPLRSKCTCGLTPYCDLHFGVTKLVKDATGKPRLMAFVACRNCKAEFWAVEAWAQKVRNNILCDACHEGFCDGAAAYRREEYDE